jgi:hypothetical protein
VFGALKNLFARPPDGKGAARRVLNIGGGGKGVVVPPHFQDWEQLPPRSTEEWRLLAKHLVSMPA